MATPGDLVKAVASALGVPETTVIQYDRHLAEAGMRSKSGRGKSAARVTPRDASNLVIAIAASPVSGPSVKEASNTCKTYASLTFRAEDSVQRFSKLGLPALDQLPPTHTLGDAISSLIASAAAGEEIGITDGPQGLPKRALSIAFFGPQPSAEINGRLRHEFKITRTPGSFGHESSSETAFFRYSSAQAALSKFPSYLGFHFEQLGLEPSSNHFGDLGQVRTITCRTIDALGKLLGEPGQKGATG